MLEGLSAMVVIVATAAIADRIVAGSSHCGSSPVAKALDISMFFPPTLAKTLAILLVALVLVVRPGGLFGEYA